MLLQHTWVLYHTGKLITQPDSHFPVMETAPVFPVCVHVGAPTTFAPEYSSIEFIYLCVCVK